MYDTKLSFNNKYQSQPLQENSCNPFFDSSDKKLKMIQTTQNFQSSVRKMVYQNKYIQFPYKNDDEKPILKFSKSGESLYHDYKFQSTAKTVSTANTLNNNKKQQNSTIKIDFIIKNPFYVKTRSEMNKQSHVIKDQNQKQEKNYFVDTQLEYSFPLKRNQKNYIKMHQQGFKSKENIDLIQHYLRMYQKNRFILKKIKNQWKLKQKLQNIDKQEKNDNINNIDEQNEDDYLQNKKELTEEEQKFVPVQLRSYQIDNNEFQFILNKKIEDYEFNNKIIQLYQNYNPNFNQNPIKGEQQELQSCLHKLKEKFLINEIKLVNMNKLYNNTLPLDPHQNQTQSCLIIEDIFIDQVQRKIKQKGLFFINPQHIRDLKQIIDRRKQQLQEILKNIQKLIYLKKSLKNQSQKNEQKYIDYQSQNLLEHNHLLYDKQQSHQQNQSQYQFFIQNLTQKQSRLKNQSLDLLLKNDNQKYHIKSLIFPQNQNIKTDMHLNQFKNQFNKKIKNDYQKNNRFINFQKLQQFYKEDFQMLSINENIDKPLNNDQKQVNDVSIPHQPQQYDQQSLQQELQQTELQQLQQSEVQQQQLVSEEKISQNQQEEMIYQKKIDEPHLSENQIEQLNDFLKLIILDEQNEKDQLKIKQLSILYDRLISLFQEDDREFFEFQIQNKINFPIINDTKDNISQQNQQQSLLVSNQKTQPSKTSIPTQQTEQENGDKQQIMQRIYKLQQNSIYIIISEQSLIQNKQIQLEKLLREAQNNQQIKEESKKFILQILENLNIENCLKYFEFEDKYMMNSNNKIMNTEEEDIQFQSNLEQDDQDQDEIFDIKNDLIVEIDENVQKDILNEYQEYLSTVQNNSKNQDQLLILDKKQFILKQLENKQIQYVVKEQKQNVYENKIVKGKKQNVDHNNKKTDHQKYNFSQLQQEQGQVIAHKMVLNTNQSISDEEIEFYDQAIQIQKNKNLEEIRKIDFEAKQQKRQKNRKLSAQYEDLDIERDIKSRTDRSLDEMFDQILPEFIDKDLQENIIKNKNTKNEFNNSYNEYSEVIPNQDIDDLSESHNKNYNNYNNNKITTNNYNNKINIDKQSQQQLKLVNDKNIKTNKQQKDNNQLDQQISTKTGQQEIQNSKKTQNLKSQSQETKIKQKQNQGIIKDPNDISNLTKKLPKHKNQTKNSLEPPADVEQQQQDDKYSSKVISSKESKQLQDYKPKYYFNNQNNANQEINSIDDKDSTDKQQLESQQPTQKSKKNSKNDLKKIDGENIDQDDKEDYQEAPRQYVSIQRIDSGYAQRKVQQDDSKKIKMQQEMQRIQKLEEQERNKQNQELIQKQKEEEIKKKEKEQKRKEEEIKKKKMEEKLQKDYEKLKKVNPKQQLALLKERNLSFKDLLIEIESFILQLGDDVDAEMKQTIELYLQRKQQINTIKEVLQEKQISKFQNQDMTIINKLMQKHTSIQSNQESNSIMKFTNQITIPEIRRTKQDTILKKSKNTEEELLMAQKYSQINNDFFQVLERIALFKDDTKFLFKLKNDIDDLNNFVRQFSQEELYLISEKNRQSKLESNKVSQYKEQNNEQQQNYQFQYIKDEKFYRYRQNLINLKSKNPQLYQNTIQKSDKILNYDNVLKALKYKEQSVKKYPYLWNRIIDSFSKTNNLFLNQRIMTEPTAFAQTLYNLK